MQTATHDQTPQEEALFGTGLVPTLMALSLILLIGVLVYGTDMFPSKAQQAWRQAMARPLSAFDAPSTSLASVELTRSGCFGFCPSYEVTLSELGAISFNGLEFTCTKGIHQKTIDPRAVRRLVAALLAIDFTNIQPEWTGVGITDAPTATVTLIINGSTHSVHHYHGDLYAPLVLSEVEDGIDAVADTAQQIGLEQNGYPRCIDESSRA